MHYPSTWNDGFHNAANEVLIDVHLLFFWISSLCVCGQEIGAGVSALQSSFSSIGSRIAEAGYVGIKRESIVCGLIQFFSLLYNPQESQTVCPHCVVVPPVLIGDGFQKLAFQFHGLLLVAMFCSRTKMYSFNPYPGRGSGIMDTDNKVSMPREEYESMWRRLVALMQTFNLCQS